MQWTDQAAALCIYLWGGGGKIPNVEAMSEFCNESHAQPPLGHLLGAVFGTLRAQHGLRVRLVSPVGA